MVEENKDLGKKCAELEQLLEEEREKTIFYQSIAEKTGKRCLREVDRLSHIISEKEKAEEAYLESEERFKVLFDSAPDAYYINDLRGKFIDGNKAVEKITGYKKEELTGKNFFKLKLLSTGQSPKAAKALAQNVLGKITGPDEFTLNRKDGSKVPVEITIHHVKFKDNKVHVLGIARDITERKKSEKKLLESEKRYRALFEQAADGIILIEMDTGKLIEFNDRAYKNLGYTRNEFKRLKISDFEVIESPEEIDKHLKKINHEGSDSFETKHRTKEGELRNILVNYRTITIHGKKINQAIHHDITEIKKAQAEKEKLVLTLMNQEKLASLGEMAAGIAHNLNNALSGFGYIDLIKPSKVEEAEYIDSMKETYKICANIVHRMLKLAEETKSEKTLGNIDLYLKDSIKSARDFYLKKTAVELIYESEHIQPFYASHYELSEAFLNLIKNGIEHTAVKGKGEVRVKLFKPKNNYHCCIEIKDTGEGIATGNIDKLFNPFFTTKEIGRGAGLGLSTAYNTVKNHGGEITVESEREMGTTFRVYLPREKNGR